MSEVLIRSGGAREASLPDAARFSAGSGSEMLVCPCCTSREWKLFARVRRASLSQCTNCGLLATTSLLANHHALSNLYDVTPRNYEEYRKHYLGSRLGFYKRVLPKFGRFAKTGRLLEVGSGYGYFLEIASRAGWEAEGVEISRYACEVARSRGCKVHQEDLLAVQLSTESYDLVVMWDVIEHLANVGPIIERCASLLRPGGAFIARTPDGRGLHTAKGLFRAAYRHLAYPANTTEHVFHFTPETLSLLMARMGLKKTVIDAGGGWEERPVPGRNPFVRVGRYLVLRHAYAKRLPYEFVITAIKEWSNE